VVLEVGYLRIGRIHEHDEKIFNRELNRLHLSLASIGEEVETKIAILHYPPFNADSTPNELLM